MKKIYLLTITCMLGLASLFTACEKEEMEIGREQGGNSDGEYFINPEDTAGIVVPEGYRLVIFPGNKAQTRALDPVASSDKVTHLQYLIYKETPKTADGTGTYTLYEQKTLFNEAGTKNWPYKSVPVVLEADANYQVVFLGNVDKDLFDKQTEVLTGVDPGATYGNARIHLPKREFSDQNMYYMGKAKFTNTPTEGNKADNVVYVPITLQRIVNRVDICKESIGDTYNLYTAPNFCDFLSNTYLMPGLKGSGGGLHRGITAQVDTLIMGLVYVGTRNFSPEADAMYTGYLSGTNKYSVLKYRYSQFQNGTYSLPADMYEYSNLSNIKTNIETVNWGGGKSTPEYADPANNYANNVVINLAQYLYDSFHKGLDNTEENEYFKIGGSLDGKWNNTVQRILMQEYQDSNESLNTAFTKGLSTLLTSTYQNEAPFKPFLQYGNIGTCFKIGVNKMPAQIDFDLNIPTDGYLNNGNPIELIYKFKAYSPNNASYLSIVSLGTPHTKLEINSIQGVVKNEWNEDIIDATGWGELPNATILSSTDTPIRASQIPNIYRKGVYKITPVSLKDKSLKSSISYPIIHSLSSTDFVGTTDAAFIKITESESSDVLPYNKKYSLSIGSTVLSTNVKGGKAGNFVSEIVGQTARTLFNKNWMYQLGTFKYAAWISLPDISANNLQYNARWVETDGNYNEISGN